MDERVIVEMVGAGASQAGAETRRLIWKAVSQRYGLAQVTTKHGTHDSGSLTPEGEKAYETCQLVLRWLADRVDDLVRRDS
jgi:hypothetical protein